MTDRRRALLDVWRGFFVTIAWLIVCGIAASVLPATPSLQVGVIPEAVLGAVLLLAGAGGLWGFWNTSWTYDFYATGFRVRWLAGVDWSYEEFGGDGMLRAFGIGYERLADTYAPPCRISLPTAADWEVATPAWVHGRRDQVLARLTKWAQRGHDAPVEFVAPGRLQQRR